MILPAAYHTIQLEGNLRAAQLDLYHIVNMVRKRGRQLKSKDVFPGFPQKRKKVNELPDHVSLPLGFTDHTKAEQPDRWPFSTAQGMGSSKSNLILDDSPTDQNSILRS